MRSLQRTLALRYGATMFVVLVAFALGADALVRSILTNQLDRALEASADRMVGVVTRGDRSLARPNGTATTELAFSGAGLVVARDSDGRVLDHNTPLADSLPLDRAALTAALAGRRSWVNMAFHSTRIRSIFVPVPGNDHRSTVVQAGSSTELLSSAANRLFAQLLFASVLGTVAATLGAGWLARSSLAPLGEIAEQARAVTARGASSFISVHGDVAELRDLIQVLNDMLARLEHAIALQRRIIADVGHELRTPITAMRGEIEVGLRGQRDSGQYRALLASVLEEVERLALMGDKLIALARYEAGDLVLQREVLDLGALVRRKADEARRRVPSAPIDIALPPDALHVDADPRLLGLVLDQVLDNAIRHTPGGTPIRIAADGGADRVGLTVEDAGPGVAAEVLGSLTEPFYRTDQARGRGGVGLGLTVVASIIALHEGSVVLSRSAMGGLRIEVSLPPPASPGGGRRAAFSSGP